MADKSEQSQNPSHKYYTSQHSRIRDQMHEKMRQMQAEIHAISLCQSVIEQLPRVFTEDKEQLSQNLCAILGETLKVVNSENGNIDPITELYEKCLEKGLIQHNEKLILDKMRTFKSSLVNDDLFVSLSYISDIRVCAATVHNVAHLLQLSGYYDEAYTLIGRLITRFEDEAPEELNKIDRSGNFFFSDWNINKTRHGFHNLSTVPEKCRPKHQGSLTAPLSQRSSYYFAMYGNEVALKRTLEHQSKYHSALLLEAFRREMDVEFLRPLVTAAILNNEWVLHSMNMLTHLEWGGEHLSLLRPMLIKQADIPDLLDDTRRACWQMELAAHVGEIDLALEINNRAFSYSEEQDFQLDNEDYFYLACVACCFHEEANEWLYHGYPDETDLPDRIYQGVDFRCSRGESLSHAVYTDEPSYIDHELIVAKWLNGFNVQADIDFILKSNLANTIEKICSLKYATCGLTPFKNRHDMVSSDT